MFIPQQQAAQQAGQPGQPGQMQNPLARALALSQQQPMPARQPMFFGQDPNMQAQIAEAQPPVDPAQAQGPSGNDQLLAAMRARQMADSMSGTTASIQAHDPLTAGLKGLSGAIEGWTGAQAKELETKNAQAADSEITNALASDDPLKALSRARTPEGRKAYQSLRLEDIGRERYTPVDVDGDGKPDFYENSKSGKREAAPMSAAEQEAAQLRMYQQTTGRENALNRAQQAQLAQAAQRAKGAANVDPNTGIRTPPPGVQGKDYAEVSKFSQQADAAANIAATLRSVAPQLDAAKDVLGPGFGAKRNVAGALSYVPGVTWAEKQMDGKGQSQTENIINNYDAIEQASKVIGIDTLQKVGGSDTERELLTAIQTTVNADATATENARRFRDQLAAADILAKKSQLASEWVNRFGSLQYAAPDGTTWQGFWPQYQREAWGDHLKSRGAGAKGAGAQGGNYREEQRQMLNGQQGPRGVAPPPGFEMVP